MPKNKKIVFDADSEVEEEDHQEEEVGTTTEQAEGKEKRKRKRKRAKVDGDKEGNTSSVVGGSAKNSISATAPAPAPAAVPASASGLVNDRTVYIEGLPFEACEADVRAFFKGVKSGDVLSVRLPTWQDSGRLRGYGHVEFTKAAAAKEALNLDGSYMGKRFIKVTTPMVPRILQQQQQHEIFGVERPPGCRSIFIKNLPYDTSEDELREAFKVFGPIVNVRIPMWGHTNQQKGSAYIDFKREDSAEIAVKKGMQIRSRPLLVDFETGQAKLSFKGPGGKGSGKSSGAKSSE